MKRWKVTHRSNGSSRGIAKSIGLAIIALLLAGTTGELLGSEPPSEASTSFDFFRIVEKSTSKNPDQLSAVTIYERGKPFVIYTERAPAYHMPPSEIISITIARERIRGWRPAQRQGTTGKAASQTKKEADTSGLEDGYVYKATFSLSKLETKRFNQFANANDKQAFDFRLKETRLGTVQFVGPFGGVSESNAEVSTFLDETNVKEIFAPFKDKVIWK